VYRLQVTVDIGNQVILFPLEKVADFNRETSLHWRVDLGRFELRSLGIVERHQVLYDQYFLSVSEMSVTVVNGRCTQKVLDNYNASCRLEKVCKSLPFQSSNEQALTLSLEFNLPPLLLQLDESSIA